MKFKKGRAKTGGRKKGVKNSTTPIKKLLSDFVRDKLGDIDDLWSELDRREKVNFLTSVLKYTTPPATIQEEDEDNTGEESAVTDTIRQLNELNNKMTG